MNISFIRTKEQKEKEIRKKYSELMRSVVAPYSPEEQQTWFTQIEEANKWLENPNKSVPLITKMAQYRNISVATLVSLIKENDELFRENIGMLLGLQQKELDELYAEE